MNDQREEEQVSNHASSEELTEVSFKDALQVFKTIWTEPRATTRFTVERVSMGFVVFLVIVSSVIQGLSGGLFPVEDAEFSALSPGIEAFAVTLAVVVAAVFALVSWVISSALIRWVGSWLGGVATFRDTLKATSLTYIPGIFIGIFTALIGSSMSTTGFANVSVIIFSILLALASVWSIVIIIKSVAEVHQFSSFKSIGTLLILFALGIILLICLAIIFSVLIGLMLTV